MARTSYLPRHAAASRDGSRGVARKATAVVATVGAAAVATTAMATPADAVGSLAVWNRVANCESSGRWHINSGNGFYGGLQFTARTWAAFGGHRYARQANRASRLEQIRVARRVLAAQGPRAWPVCGPRAHLTLRAA
jgi:resuscitation-promoting factor RpfA